jgi:hypothetical protein
MEEKLDDDFVLTSWPEGFQKACEFLDFLPDDKAVRESVMKAILSVMVFI